MCKRSNVRMHGADVRICNPTWFPVTTTGNAKLS